MIKPIVSFIVEILSLPGEYLSRLTGYVSPHKVISFVMFLVGVSCLADPSLPLNGYLYRYSPFLSQFYAALFMSFGAGLSQSHPTSASLKFWTFPLFLHVVLVALYIGNLVGVSLYGLLLFFLYRHIYAVETEENIFDDASSDGLPLRSTADVGTDTRNSHRP